MTAVVAIGGNALIGGAQPASVAQERARLAAACAAVADMVASGWRVVITHGNGPQVGAALARSECRVETAYPLTLDLCVASTQGEIGVLLEQALRTALTDKHVDRPVATVLTQVVVRRDDVRFGHPTKPIGPAGGRRLVASPEPIEIVEEPAIRALLDAGVVVIALGGGGVPVVCENGRLAGVEAVVDKDLASALLAERIQADVLVLLTDVDRIYLDLGTPQSRGLDRASTDELRRYRSAGQFPEGSMGPKVDAAIRFVTSGGREAIVAEYDQLVRAMDGRAGTHITAAQGRAL
jgi:carbamate kinase